MFVCLGVFFRKPNSAGITGSQSVVSSADGLKGKGAGL